MFGALVGCEYLCLLGLTVEQYRLNRCLLAYLCNCTRMILRTKFRRIRVHRCDSHSKSYAASVPQVYVTVNHCNRQTCSAPLHVKVTPKPRNPETPKPLRCFLIKCVRFIAYKYNRLSFVLVRMNLLPNSFSQKNSQTRPSLVCELFWDRHCWAFNHSCKPSST